MLFSPILSTLFQKIHDEELVGVCKKEATPCHFLPGPPPYPIILRQRSSGSNIKLWISNVETVESAFSEFVMSLAYSTECGEVVKKWTLGSVTVTRITKPGSHRSNYPCMYSVPCLSLANGYSRVRKWLSRHPLWIELETMTRWLSVQSRVVTLEDRWGPWVFTTLSFLLLLLHPDNL